MLSIKSTRYNLFNVAMICQLLFLVFVATCSISEGAVAALQSDGGPFDTPALRLVSDSDAADQSQIKHHIANDYSEFKTIDEVTSFLDKVKLLVQKHPKNVAFAKDDLKELLKFLSSEVVTKLIRVDTDQFVQPLSDDKLLVAQRAIDEDELTRKLFGVAVRSVEEKRRTASARPEDGGNHKDGNFFTNIWCKVSGSCQH